MGIFQRSGKNDSGKSRGRTLRPVLLALILAAVCWGFWGNTQRRLENIIEQGLLTDQTNSLSAGHKTEIVSLLKTFSKDFGIPLEVNILKRPPGLNEHKTSRIYLDIVPDQDRAYIFLPPLVRHAVGDEFIRDFEEKFRQSFASGDWRPGLLTAVLALRAKLAQVTR